MLIDFATTLSLVSAAGVVALAFVHRARGRKLQALVEHLETNQRRWQELEALRATMTPCPTCGARGGYPSEWQGRLQ
jgi:hypothetical protein